MAIDLTPPNDVCSYINELLQNFEDIVLLAKIINHYRISVEILRLY